MSCFNHGSFVWIFLQGLFESIILMNRYFIMVVRFTGFYCCAEKKSPSVQSCPDFIFSLFFPVL